MLGTPSESVLYDNQELRKYCDACNEIINNCSVLSNFLHIQESPPESDQSGFWLLCSSSRHLCEAMAPFNFNLSLLEKISEEIYAYKNLSSFSKSKISDEPTTWEIGDKSRTYSRTLFKNFDRRLSSMLLLVNEHPIESHGISKVLLLQGKRYQLFRITSLNTSFCYKIFLAEDEIDSEINLMKDVHHHKIVRFLGYVESEGSKVLVFSPFGGQVLHAYLKSHDITHKERLRISHELAEIMLFLSSKGLFIVLTLKSFIINDRGEILLIDLGDHKKSVFAAPEIFLRHEATESSMAWTTGMLIYSIIFQEKPFISQIKQEQNSSEKVMMRIIFQNLRPTIPNEFRIRHRQLCDLILSTWETKPESRVKLGSVVTSLKKIRKKME